MEQILSEISNNVRTKTFTSLTLIMGNVSCDLDSAISAIVFSLFKHWQHQDIRSKVCTRQYRCDRQTCQVFAPIINAKRSDYEIKTEVEHCLSGVGLNKNDLLFRDDLDYEDLLKTNEIKVILVDHHILAKEDEFFKPYVTEIIDHRPKEVKNWSYGEEVRADIQLIGSCSSLICDRIKNADSCQKFFEEFPQCANLIYSTIILDTVNFSQDIKKVTPFDMEQIEFLENVMNITDISHRETRLKELIEARSDVSKLSAAQMLRKDVKFFTSFNIMVPSFPVLVEDILKRQDSEMALYECEARAVVLLGVCLNGPVRRDLAVFCKEKDVLKKIVKLLQECTDPTLDLTECETSIPNCRYFEQKNLAASRKQIMPILTTLTL